MGRKKKFQVVYSIDFVKCVQPLDRDDKARANEAADRWKKDPTSPDYVYERVEGAPDARLRVLRLTQKHTAIVLRSDKQDAYVLLWLDTHDAALTWAREHRCEVNPQTGSLQVFRVDLTSEARASEDHDAKVGGIFDAYSGKQLEQLGVPRALMFRVRHAMSVADFEVVGLQLPSDAYEALLLLIEEEQYNDVLELVTGSSIPSEREFDTEDIASALENDTTRQRFKIVDNEDELERVFSGDIENWRVFLHRSQRRLVTKSVKGSVRVLGGAGTGKTVVAMHRAVHLARKVFTSSDDRILFTTFTANLAKDIEANLRTLCDAETMKRIEVVSLDKWVARFLKKQGFSKKIKYFSNTGDDELNRLWEEALEKMPTDESYPRSFYREEWEQVIQARAIKSKREYFRADRSGRGFGMRRGPRAAVWPVFETYQNRMADEGVCEREDALYAARKLLEDESVSVPYCSVIVDEAQDMSNEAFKLLRAIVPREESQALERDNDIFIVGDGHQRIYNHKVILSRCGIRIVGRGHSYRLRINYRTSEEIRRFAVGVLEGLEIDDLDGGQDSHKGYTSLIQGVAPTVKAHASLAQELDTIQEYVEQYAEQGSVCLVTRTNDQISAYKAALEARGLTTYKLSRSAAEDLSKPGLRLATMHRVKGLEFDRVILAGVDKGTVPLETIWRDTEDDATREGLEIQERALFYVACTRAKKDVLVTSSGELSELVR